MKKIVSILMLLSLTPSAFATKTKTFELTYEVVQAYAMCVQMCKYQCEEPDYEVFYDVNTFKKISAAADQGLTYTFGGVEGGCGDEDGIVIAEEDLFQLQKEDPKKAFELLKEKGTPLNVVIYNDLRTEVRDFIHELADEK